MTTIDAQSQLDDMRERALRELEDARPEDGHRDRAVTPCDAPVGGWKIVDPSKVADEHPLLAAARSQPDFGGLWFDDLGAHQDG